LFDQSSCTKIEISGPDAFQLLEYLSTTKIGPIGSVTYTLMCNEKGGIECEVMIARTKVDEFYLVTGTALAVRDFMWIKRHIGNLTVNLKDLTGLNGCFTIAGPLSVPLLEKVATEEKPFNDFEFPVMSCKQIAVGAASVLALRVPFLEQCNWELHFPQEYGNHIYEILKQEGALVQIRDAGYFAMNSLRTERGFFVWGSEMSSDTNPYQIGLEFLLDETKKFKGSEALKQLSTIEQPKKIICLSVKTSKRPLLGGEPIVCNGKIVGLTSSACYCYSAGKYLAFGYIPRQGNCSYQILVCGEAVVAEEHPIHHPIKQIYVSDN